MAKHIYIHIGRKSKDQNPNIGSDFWYNQERNGDWFIYKGTLKFSGPYKSKQQAINYINAKFLGRNR